MPAQIVKVRFAQQKLRPATCFLLCIFLSACTNSCNDAVVNHLHFGTVDATARMTITLHESKDKLVIFQKFERAAQQNGFAFLYGSRTDMLDADALHKSRLYTWLSEDRTSAVYVTSISLVLNNIGDTSDSFEFYLDAPSGQESFDAGDWRQFFRWRNTILPDEFPNATFEITVHPAAYTNFDVLEQVSEDAGIPIPAHIMVKYEDWLRKNK